MEFKELHDYLKKNNNIEYLDVNTGILLRDKRFDTIIGINWKDLEKLSISDIVVALTGGKDVEQITRVTGFFSKISSWNKGKLAELRDRSRVSI